MHSERKNLYQYSLRKQSADDAIGQFLKSHEQSRVTSLHERPVDFGKNDKKKVVFLGTGGTFQSQNTGKGLDATVDLHTVLSHLNIRERRDMDIIPIELFCGDSANFRIAEWKVIAESIVHLLKATKGQIHGIIIGHGTDTLDVGDKYTSLMMGSRLKIPITFFGTQQPGMSDTSPEPRRKVEDSIRATAIAIDQSIAEVMTNGGGELIRAMWSEKRTGDGTNIFHAYNGIPLLNFSSQSDDTKWIFPDYSRKVQEGKFAPFTDIKGSDADIVYLDPSVLGHKVVANILRETRGAVLKMFGSATMNKDTEAVIQEFHQAGKPMVLQRPFCEESDRHIGDYLAGSTLTNIPYLYGLYKALAVKMHFAFSKHGSNEGSQYQNKYGWVYPKKQILENIEECIIEDRVGENFTTGLFSRISN